MKTEEANNLFLSIQELQTRETSSGGSDGSVQSRVEEIVENIMEKLEEIFFDVVSLIFFTISIRIYKICI